MKTINHNSHIPLYQQLVQIIRSDIESGFYRLNEKIPSESEVEERYGVSRIVVRRAMSILEEGGYITKRRGKGTFVTWEQVVEPLRAQGSFTQAAKMLGREPKTEVISIGEIDNVGNSWLRKNFPNYDQLVCVERLRYIDDILVIYEKDYFPPCFTFLSKEDIETRTIMDIIKNHTDLQAHSIEDTIDIVSSTKKMNYIFNFDISVPLLHVKQRVLSNDDQIVYVNEQFIDHRLYKYTSKREID